MVAHRLPQIQGFESIRPFIYDHRYYTSCKSLLSFVSFLFLFQPSFFEKQMRPHFDKKLWLWVLKEIILIINYDCLRTMFLPPLMRLFFHRVCPFVGLFNGLWSIWIIYYEFVVLVSLVWCILFDIGFGIGMLF